MNWPLDVSRTLLLISAAVCVLSGRSAPPAATPQAPTLPAELHVTVEDAQTADLIPVRVRLTDSSGRAAPLPDEAIRVQWGRNDRAEGFGYQPDSSFYVDGSFRLQLPPGRYTLSLSKGNEYLAQQHVLELGAGERTSNTYQLERWIDTPSRGWYSADDHIHVRRSPREDPLLRDWIAAEDIHVGVMLWMGDFWTTYYQQYAFGKEGVYREGRYLLTSGQEEPRTPELGHTIGIGASKPVRFEDDYYLYDKVFDELHQHGGMTGYAHQAVTFHGHRGITLDGLRRKVDVLELLQFCAPEGPLLTENYYRLLDLGYRITATAGSDFPWCGRDHRYGVENAPEHPSQIGDVRFYTYTGSSFSYETWKAGLDAGRTFVSSGPVLEFRVNGKRPGATVDLSSGETVSVSLQAFGHSDQVPLSRLELVAHGETIRSVTPRDSNGSRSHLTLDVELPIERGVWLAARANGGPLQVAHTTPIYVTIDGGSFHNPETAEKYLRESEGYLEEVRHVISHRNDRVDHHAWRYREGLEKRIADTQQVIDSLRRAFSENP